MDLAPPPAGTTASDLPAPESSTDPPPERVLGGVAALLAERLEVDALWVRVGFVLLGLVSGLGVVVYAALWSLLVVGADPDRRWARLLGGAVLVGGLPLVLSGGFEFFDGPGAVLALLAGLALALWQPRDRGGPSEPPPPGRVPASPAAAPERDADERAAATWRRRPRLAPRPPSVLGRATLGAALLVAALGALIDQANGGRLHPEQWLGAAAVVCGAGLVAGAFAGRARWLIVPAALFAGTGLVAGEAAGVGVRAWALGGDEYVYVGPDSPGDRVIREDAVLGTVTVTIDGAPTAPVTVDARVGIGDVRVHAAEDVAVEVRADTDHGMVQVHGDRRPAGSFTVGPEGPPDVVVIARVGRGDVHVDTWFREPELALPPTAPDPVQYVADGVALATGGRVVLGDGEAVIDADDTVLSGSTRQQDRVTWISTAYGEFQLLPGGLLLTPYGELLDLHALRGDSPASEQVVPPVSAPAPDPSGPVGPTIPATAPATTPGG